MIGFSQGDAAYHREQRCNQDCNQGRNCGCGEPMPLTQTMEGEEIERLRKVMFEAWQDHDWLLIANEVYDMKDVAKPHIGNEPLEPGRDGEGASWTKALYRKLYDEIERLNAHNALNEQSVGDCLKEIERLRQQRDELAGLVKRYLKETPLGHQPHMIAHIAEAALAKIEGELK